MVLRDLLGKLVVETELLAFLSRMIGEPVAATDTIILSSTQRARMVAWLNEQGVAADFNRFKSNLIRVAGILTAEVSEPEAETAAAVPLPVAAPAAGGAAFLGLGIDIQACASMPEATDFRADKFYAANFASRELAHCIQQGDPLDSFAGLWAAKEAIVKAGAGARGKNGTLAEIEIVHEPSGAPTYPGCLLSISHDHGVAVAVCIRLR